MQSSMESGEGISRAAVEGGKKRRNRGEGKRGKRGGAREGGRISARYIASCNYRCGVVWLELHTAVNGWCV